MLLFSHFPSDELRRDEMNDDFGVEVSSRSHENVANLDLLLVFFFIPVDLLADLETRSGQKRHRELQVVLECFVRRVDDGLGLLVKQFPLAQVDLAVSDGDAGFSFDFPDDCLIPGLLSLFSLAVVRVVRAAKCSHRVGSSKDTELKVPKRRY